MALFRFSWNQKKERIETVSGTHASYCLRTNYSVFIEIRAIATKGMRLFWKCCGFFLLQDVDLEVPSMESAL